MLTLVMALLASAAPRPPAARLVYDAGGTTCPDKAALINAVTRRVGTEAFSPDAKDSVVVQVTPSAGSLRATVTRMSGGAESGRRELSSPTTDCRELFQALELAVAMAVDPSAGLAGPASPPAPPAPATATEAAQPVTVTSKPLAWRLSDGPSDTPVNRMTRGALLAERDRLDAKAPGTGIAFLLAGSAMTAAGIGVNIAAVVVTGTKPLPDWAYPAIGSALIALGVTGIVVGILQRIWHADDRPVFERRFVEIDARLVELGQATDPGPPTPMVRGQTPTGRNESPLP